MFDIPEQITCVILPFIIDINLISYNEPTGNTLLKVHNDILISMEKGEVTALTLLDLSAAFDPIDHATLTDRLSD